MIVDIYRLGGTLTIFCKRFSPRFWYKKLRPIESTWRVWAMVAGQSGGLRARAPWAMVDPQSGGLRRCLRWAMVDLQSGDLPVATSDGLMTRQLRIEDKALLLVRISFSPGAGNCPSSSKLRLRNSVAIEERSQLFSLLQIIEVRNASECQNQRLGRSNGREY